MTSQRTAGSGLEAKYSVHETGPRIEQFLRQIITNGEFELEFAIEPGDQSNPDFENPDLIVKFNGADVDLLLANRAELLLALELVTQEALRIHSDDHSRISFDANDYRALRIEELRMSALAAAEKVKRTGAPFRFNPMNSRERRVLHIALRNETELRSESAGAGPFRHVVVYPAGMASLPDPPPPPFGGHHDRGGDRGGNRDRDRGRGGDRHGGGGGRDRRPGGPRRPPSNRTEIIEPQIIELKETRLSRSPRLPAVAGSGLSGFPGRRCFTSLANWSFYAASCVRGMPPSASCTTEKAAWWMRL